MQDYRSFDDGNGGIFIGGGDLRMRPNNNNNNMYQNQAMKCPRCDSPNTKFCYYNNYNLSQPRHYCKGCRRYWTKGGVLRNVPVGGSCRKTKRSKPIPSADDVAISADVDSAVAAASVEIHAGSNCSSESSSLTATPTPVAAVVTDSNHFTVTSFILPESRFSITPQTATATVTESNDSTVFDFINNNVSYDRLNTTTINNHQQLREDQQKWQLHDIARNNMNDEHEVNLEDITTGLTEQVDWDINGTGDGGDNEESLLIHQFTAGAVDQSYWSQNQWSDHDHSLY